MDRIRELDGLRGLGSLMIMLFHAWPAVFFLGWSRVDLFLVMSGYLITIILLKYGFSGPFLASFYARRALRILPVYYIGLAGVVGLNAFHASPESLDGLIRYATLTQNVEYYYGGDAPAFPGRFFHTWTILVEERFYLIWPALLWIMGPRHASVFCVALVALCPWLRAMGFVPWILPGRADSLAMGCLLALGFAGRTWGDRARALMNRGLGVAGLAALAGIVWISLTYPMGDKSAPPGGLRVALTYTFSGAAFFAALGLVHLNAGGRWLAPLRARWLTSLGVISYGIYMYHPLCFWVANGIGVRWLPGWENPLMGGAMVATLLVAWASYRLVEEPLLGLKGRFPYRRPSGETVAVPEADGAALGSGPVRVATAIAGGPPGAGG